MIGNGKGDRLLAAGAGSRQHSLSPDGRMLALVRGGDANDVVLANLESPGARLRRLFSGAGVRALVWSPDGRWLLVSWPAADQWVFVRVAGRPRIAAGIPDRRAARDPHLVEWVPELGRMVLRPARSRGMTSPYVVIASAACPRGAAARPRPGEACPRGAAAC